MSQFLKQWADTCTALFIFLFSIVLFLLIPYQIAMIESEKISMTPSFYPILVISFMAIISLIYLITSFIEEKKKRLQPDESAPEENARLKARAETKRALVTIGIILGYIYLIEIVGFYIASPLGIAAMMAHMGKFRIKTFLIVIVLLLPIVHIFFEKIMVLILPRGIFF